MASLLILLIILGCAAYQYFKGTLVKAFATIIIAVCASIAAFGYFEVLANVFVSRGGNSRFPSLVPWAQPLCFALLFIVVFGILQTLAMQLTRKPIDLGFLPERIGRVACGIFLGLMLSGLLLTFLVMAPLPNKYPYPRFDQGKPDTEKPNKALLNADGFVTGWFSILSSGSFSGKKSFATLHPNFLDQVFLNRYSVADNVSIITDSQAIEIPNKAVWPAPQGLKDSNGQPVSPKSGHNLTIVRVGIKKSELRDAGKFTLSQLRLICKPKGYAKGPLTGKGRNVYPIGYLKAADQIEVSSRIQIERDDFEKDAREKEIDFVFRVPNDFEPVLVEFKLNNIAQIRRSAIVSADQAPPPVLFTQTSKSKKDTGKSDKPSQQRNSSPQNQPGTASPSREGDQFEEQ
ncbi:MAG: hypothetical protein ACYTBX_17270 [Planctomycetota bacterium]